MIPLHDQTKPANTLPEDESLDSSGQIVLSVRSEVSNNEGLVTRSQAKRLMLRVDGFRIVVLDFFDVSRIGQAFADEVFRVFANEHPQIELQSIHAIPEVQQMIRRAEVARDEANGAQLSLP